MWQGNFSAIHRNGAFAAFFCSAYIPFNFSTFSACFEIKLLPLSSLLAFISFLRLHERVFLSSTLLLRCFDSFFRGLFPSRLVFLSFLHHLHHIFIHRTLHERSFHSYRIRYSIFYLLLCHSTHGLLFTVKFFSFPVSAKTFPLISEHAPHLMFCFHYPLPSVVSIAKILFLARAWHYLPLFSPPVSDSQVTSRSLQPFL